MKNLFFKSGILFFFLLIIIGLLVQEIKSIEDKQTRMTYILQGDYLLFNLPDDIKNNFTPDEVALVFEKIKKETNLDVLFRSTNYTPYKKNDSIDVSKDIIEVTFYSDAIQKINNNKMFFSNNVFFSVKPFVDLSNEHLNDGSFFVKTNSNEQFSAFVLAMKNQFSILLKKDISIHDFEVSIEEVNASDYLPTDPLSDISLTIIFAFVFFIIFIIIWIVSIARDVAIYRLNGFSLLKISASMIIKEFIYFFPSFLLFYCCLMLST